VSSAERRCTKDPRIGWGDKLFTPNTIEESESCFSIVSLAGDEHEEIRTTILAFLLDLSWNLEGNLLASTIGSRTSHRKIPTILLLFEAGSSIVTIFVPSILTVGTISPLSQKSLTTTLYIPRIDQSELRIDLSSLVGFVNLLQSPRLILLTYFSYFRPLGGLLMRDDEEDLLGGQLLYRAVLRVMLDRIIDVDAEGKKVTSF
jgi:hypothetical protein